MIFSFKSAFFFILLFSVAAFAQEVSSSAASSNLQQLSESKHDATGVSAQAKQSANNSNLRGGLIVTAFLGVSKTAPTDLTVSQPSLNTNLTFRDVKLASRSFQSPQYYGLRIGYFVPQLPLLGVEAEFIHLKVYSNPEQRVRASGVRRGTAIDGEIRLGDIVRQYSISHGANFLLFNLAARRGFASDANTGKSRLILTGRAGIGPTIPHTESNIEGNQQEQYERGRIGWQLAGSGEFKLFGGLHALGEYKYTQTRQRGKIFAGTAESFLRTHHGVFGLSYHF